MGTVTLGTQCPLPRERGFTGPPRSSGFTFKQVEEPCFRFCPECVYFHESKGTKDNRWFELPVGAAGTLLGSEAARCELTQVSWPGEVDLP